MEQQPTKPAAGGSGLAPNVASALCYLCNWLTGLIFLIIEKDNKEIKFHAWQAILLGIALYVVFFAMFIIAWIPYLGWLVWFAYILVVPAYVIVWIICMLKAYKGEKWVIPVIGPIAEQQAAK